jgi:hypothetical protein
MNIRPLNPFQERFVLSFDFASTTTTVATKLWKTSAGRLFRIDRVFLNSPTGLAANASNYATFNVLNGALVAAKWSTLTGAEGTLSADVPVDLTTTAASLGLPVSTNLSFQIAVTGTVTVPAGRIVVEGRYL